MNINPMMKLQDFWNGSIINYLDNPWNIITLIIDIVIVIAILVDLIISIISITKFDSAIKKLNDITNLKIR